MKPEDRVHRSDAYGAAPKSAGDRPPLLLKHLGKGARVRLVCGACSWSRTYDPYRLIARLKEKGAGGEATAIAHVARHVQWPCPMCRRMAWAAQPDWPAAHASAAAHRSTSPAAAAAGGGGPRPEEGVVEGESRPHRAPTRTLMTKRARALRKEMSEPEVMLWSRLRGRRSGERPRFRRQHPIGTIIVDFFCAAAQLAIEVDGRTHWDDEARAKDGTRDRWLRSQGVSVLRIPAGDIYADLAGVTDAIIRRAEELQTRPPCGGLSPSTIPSAGNGPPPPAAPRRGR